ncbi:hypothetical protein [Rhizocola hellebori]|nr:hypothetical protein [Rhizocola hellebori]
MGHVFVRLSGFGMRLLPYWPYEFERDGETPDRVRVTHWADASRLTATVDSQHRESAEGIVDVSPGPEHQYWRAETGIYGFTWPDGFVIGVSVDANDPTPFYLFGPDEARIYPQGPFPTEKMLDAAGWTGPGQKLAAQYHLDDIEVFELDFEYADSPWWQTHWAFPVGAGQSLVISGQCPAAHHDLVRNAIRHIVETLSDTQP